ncbi:hypothetical protein OF375_00025 [Ureaplasma miroungigenitalium]|uniref:Vmc-like lipoprotein signal peptide domain-containing protein n=1 Tax=Ureaplasma miroungigenitalium TaxID=1042321 RepID=UPI0021E75A14|nr:hypothetical protein [Ureaplasma miroungigenitalium]MCV3733981.1 hypothetical protein [Ureaplasma miroungigenitalium]
MNKKQKRILGFVLAPIALVAITTPIVTSCSKQTRKTTTRSNQITKTTDELKQIHQEFILIIEELRKKQKDAGTDVFSADLWNALIKKTNEQFYKLEHTTTLSDEQKQKTIALLKEQIEHMKKMMSSFPV